MTTQEKTFLDTKIKNVNIRLVLVSASLLIGGVWTLSITYNGILSELKSIRSDMREQNKEQDNRIDVNRTDIDWLKKCCDSKDHTSVAQNIAVK